jgi:hypothetical protein
MAREGTTLIENTFKKGLITEATGLNFPEHAAIDAENVKFNSKGNVTRRLGIDLEEDFEYSAYDNQVGVIREFVWQAVGNSGGSTFFVLQKGEEITFYELNQEGSLSAGLLAAVLDLNDYIASGAGPVQNIPASFASGSGYLFIAHPFCDPIIVRYDNTSETFEAARVTIRIRDFEGVEDGLAVNENPATLSTLHHYNLKNQGWDQTVRVGSVTNDIGAGGGLSPSPTITLTWSAL